MFLGFLLGSLGKVKGVKLPFGPSLITGAFVAVLWGGNMWDWYRAFIGLQLVA
jgi:prepilin signal peptidase PulO-like enzyme (type II secretory pathway)